MVYLIPKVLCLLGLEEELGFVGQDRGEGGCLRILELYSTNWKLSTSIIGSQ